ncbi:Coiled-coil domain-containing protein 6 [Acipenser ruthenus]|uniref:Coiled-coil domain-containing protein 6 n=1 Tax=Acipenser ruthenus TaxID=7906 RepID=A0A444UHJ2_ACIRT|nr:Coiled-coil domain-containing protein 6 [Acipenser ruthenus]
MADSASESETDGAGSGSAALTPSSSKAGIVISPFRLEELTNRLASLQQENKVLKIELETYKLKCKALQEENRELRKASVTIVSMRLSQHSKAEYFNEMSAQGLRPRTVSSPIPYTPSPSSSRPISPEAFPQKKQQP